MMPNPNPMRRALCCARLRLRHTSALWCAGLGLLAVAASCQRAQPDAPPNAAHTTPDAPTPPPAPAKPALLPGTSAAAFTTPSAFAPQHAPAQAAPPPPAVARPSTPQHTPPHAPTPLAVPGFQPASHVGPRASSGPQPVIVVLHGNFDRPEWQCERWAAAADAYGWILCPRGVRTPWASLAEDRWTYVGAARVQAEIDAALDALDARYPGRVSREDTMLAGFSLGAILAPELAIAQPGQYRTLFLIEGGLSKLTTGPRLRALHDAGVRGVGLAMSMPGRYRRAQKAANRLGAHGFKTLLIDMQGAGHNYRADFAEQTRAALPSLLERRASE